MCMSGKAPEVPPTPERQAAKLPDGGGTANSADQQSARRRALMASIVTGMTAKAGAPVVSGMGTATKLG